MTAGERFLVTGAMGCIGAWTVRLLLDEGTPVTALDLARDDARLRLLAAAPELERVTIVRGDITDPAVVRDVVREQRISHVVHCAALQVPYVRADPPAGARVNVLGTINVLEAAVAHREQVAGVAYASSGAVFGPPGAYPGGAVNDDSPHLPDGTLYGVFKHANEHTAQHYAQERGVVAVGLRPFVVYGPGRDQGMTSTPTTAILAATVGQAYHLDFGGALHFNFAADAAAAFLAAARLAASTATVFNIPGTTATADEFVGVIEECLPDAGGLITHGATQLASPTGVDPSNAPILFGDRGITSLSAGIDRTVEIFRAGLRDGRLRPPTAEVRA